MVFYEGKKSMSMISWSRKGTGDLSIVTFTSYNIIVISRITSHFQVCRSVGKATIC